MKPELEFFGQKVEGPIEIRKVKEFNERRRKFSHLETLFYTKWEEMLSESEGKLGMILNDGRVNHFVQEYDEVMCAALIQWLATCVGSGFLRDVFNSVETGLGNIIWNALCEYEQRKKKEKEFEDKKEKDYTNSNKNLTSPSIPWSPYDDLPF